MNTGVRKSLLIGGFFALILGAVCAMVAQPLVIPDAFRAPSADPVRLKQHVVKLSRGFFAFTRRAG